MSQLQRYHVVSGTYVTSEKKPLLLKAFLGTCVGITLRDPAAGVGGLIHLLLPEPVVAENDTHPARYAATGIPLLIEQLVAAGARREGIRASVAGGALICPANESDLNLDIGGRTAERAFEILDENDIAIDTSETGGLHSYCLRLNLLNLTSKIEILGAGEVSQNSRIEMPQPGEIARAIERLLPIPQVALKILRMIEEDDHSKEAIAREIRKDQVITGRTLQLCNSVLFERRHKLDSVHEAVVMLGQNLLAKLIISVAARNFIRHCFQGYSLCKGGLYHHSIGTAIIAEHLARLAKFPKPMTAFTAGLLHDIGKVVLDQYVASTAPLFYRGVFKENQNIIDVERNLFGTDHIEVGCRLAESWSFPGSLLEVIRHHKNPQQASQAPTLCYIVYLANLLMSWVHAGMEIERTGGTDLDAALNKIGLSGFTIPQIIDQLPAKLFGSIPELALA